MHMAYGEAEVECQSLLTSTLDKNGQLHAWASLYPAPIQYETNEENISCTCWELNHDS